jgi:hypothetical protein
MNDNVVETKTPAPRHEAMDLAFLASCRSIVSTVGRDEEMIRAYIKNQEMADKQLDQMQLKLASS